MTILWIYNQPLIPEAGGTERVTSLVSRGLSERGHNCMGILVFNETDGSMTYEGETINDLYSFIKEQNVDVVINQIAYAKWLLKAFLSNGGYKWRSEGGKIISCLHFDPCNPSYIQLLKSKEKLSLRDCFNFIKHILLKSYYNNKKQSDEGDVYNYIYDNSDVFVTLSTTHFNYLRKVMRRNDYSKLNAIGNPLTFDIEISPDNLDNKTNTLLVCARMSEYHKRISIILKTWKKLQNRTVSDGWQLKIVGDGPDLDRYKRYATGNNLKNVEFTGNQNPEPYYREAKILLLTSSAEGWGLTLTEAMQYGVVPIVMNSSPVYTDIITHLHNGLLCPNDNINAFAKNIKHLLDDPYLLKAMQCNALLSSRKFTLNKSIDKWEKLLAII